MTVAPLRVRLRIDVFTDLARVRIRRGQRVLDAVIDLRLHVGLDALEDGRISQALAFEPSGEGLERIALAHPLLLLVPRAVLAVDVADVMAVVAVGLALEERRPLAPPRTLHEAPHRRVDRLDVLAVDALGVDAQRARARQDLAGNGLGPGRVLAGEGVLADIDDARLPDRRHVHRVVEQALTQRAVAEESDDDLSAPAPL